ncbi:MAG: haloacid dehalogenase type II [Pseudomonadota bacterium]
MAFEAAIFDVFGTVVNWRRGVSEAVAPALAAKGIEIEPASLADAWRNEYQPSMERVRAGERPYTRLDTLHHENLLRVLERMGLADRFTVEETAALNTAWERLPGWPDAPAGIAAIRAHRLVAPCSNGSIGMMARIARFAGLEWDCILGADVARAYKPDPAAYLGSAAALGLEPGSVLMVAAHNADLAAARAAGLGTAFVPRPHEHGPGQTTDLGPEAEWDVVAEDLIALAARLEPR